MHIYVIMTVAWESSDLVTTAKHGKKRLWKVRVEAEGDSVHICTEFGDVGGKVQLMKKQILTGKNIGKKNETTVVEQAILEAKALYKKNYDKSQVKVLPMLATPWTPKSKIDAPHIFVQPKIDGVRVMVNSEGVYSRTGKEVKCLDHIFKEANEKMKLTKTKFLDGECFSDSMTFEEISGSFRKEVQCSTLKMHVFDLFDTESPEPFHKRVKRLKKGTHLVPVKTELIKNDSQEIIKYHDTYVARGWEGIMIRSPDSLYLPGYRSQDLKKYKSFKDEEFQIVGVEEGSGKDMGTAIFECKLNTSDGTFHVRPKGSLAQRKEYWINRHMYLHKLLTVQYQEMTDTSVPRFPVGVAVRNYE